MEMDRPRPEEEGQAKEVLEENYPARVRRLGVVVGASETDRAPYAAVEVKRIMSNKSWSLKLSWKYLLFSFEELQ